MTINHTVMPADAETIAAWQSHFAETTAAGEGMLTSDELATIAGVGRRTMQTQLQRGLADGLYVMEKAYRQDVFGRRQLVPVYKLIVKSKPKRKRK